MSTPGMEIQSQKERRNETPIQPHYNPTAMPPGTMAVQRKRLLRGLCTGYLPKVEI